MAASLARDRSLDHYPQPVAGVGERMFHPVLGVAFGEDETQVAVPVGQRAYSLADRDGDAETGDTGGGRGFGPALDGAEYAGPRHGQHEHTGRTAGAVPGD